MAFSGSGPNNAEINITPLIDVLLVLIIIFMVIDAQHAQRKGLKAEIPQQADQTSPPTPVRTIVVQLRATRPGEPPTLKINSEEVRWDTLKPRLQAIYNTRAEKVAFLEGDKDIDFDYFAQVIDITRQAGAERVGLLPAQPPLEASDR